MLNFGFMLESGAGGGSNPWFMIIMIGLIVVMFVFMSRSQKKKDKAAQEMRDGLQVGDEVTTIGGIIGKIVSIKGETFVLESTKDKTRIRFLKGAVRSVDVRAADIAASILETKTAAKDETAEASESIEAPAEEENTENKN